MVTKALYSIVIVTKSGMQMGFKTFVNRQIMEECFMQAVAVNGAIRIQTCEDGDEVAYIPYKEITLFSIRDWVDQDTARILTPRGQKSNLEM